MTSLSLPLRYALIGAVAALVGALLLIPLLGMDPGAPWWALTIAGGVGGYVGGLLRARRGR